jgi:hypothetical protein
LGGWSHLNLHSDFHNYTERRLGAD